MTTIYYYPDNIRKFIADLPRGDFCVKSAGAASDSPHLRAKPAASGNLNPAILLFYREGRKGVDTQSAVLQEMIQG
jgi:hypothetical protein